MRWAACIASILLAVVLSACGEDSPEQQIERRIAEAESLAQSRDVRGLRRLVATSYADGRGRSKADIEALMAYRLMQQGEIHLLTRIREIRLVEPGRAEAVVVVAYSDRLITAPQDLVGAEADLVLVELELVEESPGDWLVAGAVWRGATAADFL